MIGDFKFILFEWENISEVVHALFSRLGVVMVRVLMCLWEFVGSVKSYQRLYTTMVHAAYLLDAQHLKR